MVRLELSGAGVAKCWVEAVTDPMSPVPLPRSDPRYAVTNCFGAKFDVAIGPHRPIQGVVRDAETGKPLAGAEVLLSQYAGSRLGVDGFISAVTGADGRYELTGIPRANRYRGPDAAASAPVRRPRLFPHGC